MVPDSWSLVSERALATGLNAEGLYSEHCRRAELPERKGEEVLKGIWELDEKKLLLLLTKKLAFDPLLNR